MSQQQEEQSQSSAAATGSSAAMITPALDPSTFHCSICMDLQYKPCVNTCGHSACFWCFHQAMNMLDTRHSCPLCRMAYCYFPAVCMPLHTYLAKQYPEEMKCREAEIVQQEREEFQADSPAVPSVDGDGNALDVRNAFQCVECHELACPPSVLTCGHIVCAARQKHCCPVEGCFGKMMMGGKEGTPAVCAAIDTIIRNELSETEYQEATATSMKMCAGYVDEVDASDASGRPDAPTSSTSDVVSTYIHYGVGCDGCGVYPMVGRRYKCEDCAETIGFDLCGDCYGRGVHKREQAGGDGTVAVGRFNQKHRPEHTMTEMEQPHTFLHEMQRRHPDTPLSQLVQMVQMQEGGDDDEDESEDEGEEDSESESDSDGLSERNDDIESANRRFDQAMRSVLLAMNENRSESEGRLERAEDEDSEAFAGRVVAAFEEDRRIEQEGDDGSLNSESARSAHRRFNQAVADIQELISEGAFERNSEDNDSGSESSKSEISDGS